MMRDIEIFAGEVSGADIVLREQPAAALTSTSVDIILLSAGDASGLSVSKLTTAPVSKDFTLFAGEVTASDVVLREMSAISLPAGPQTYTKYGGGAVGMAGSGSKTVTSSGTVYTKAGGGAMGCAGSGSQVVTPEGGPIDVSGWWPGMEQRIRIDEEEEEAILMALMELV